MKKSEIKVGGHYVAKVSDKLVTVRVDAIRKAEYPTSGSARYDVTNLSTGRKTTFRSAMKFRSVAAAQTLSPAEADAIEQQFPEIDPSNPSPEEQEAAGEEGEQGADPTSAPSAASPSNPVNAEVKGSASPVTSGLAAALAKNNVPTDNAPHVIVEARAGTGKTTTLVCGLRILKGLAPTVPVLNEQGVKIGEKEVTPSPQQRAVWDSIALSSGARSVCFVAFNKAIATELQTRVPPGCDAITLHSMGFKAINRAFNRLKVNEYRVEDIIADVLGRNSRDLRRDKPIVLKAVKELVGLCKMNLTDLQTESVEALTRLASHYEVDVNGSRADVFDLVPRVLERCKDPLRDGCLDFDDMVWLPVVLGLPIYRYDLLLVDEAQDLNRCQQALAKSAGKRLILCGDPKQAIYGFAGADSDSMPRMTRELSDNGRGCITLPLTVTRRCGKAIVTEANKLVPDFEAFETNPEGKISTATYPTCDGKERPKPHYTERVESGDMVLCRVNAPLVSQCFRFIRAGKKANIQGRDVGRGLVSTVEKLMKGYTTSFAGSGAGAEVQELIRRLSDWLEQETGKEQAKRNPSEARLIALQDRHDCLLCFTEGVITVKEVVAKIEAIFTDSKDKTGIRLSSIHKSKGLESSRVFLLEPKGATVPHPMAKSVWQREQEMNLRYVAVTRAINELVFVS